MSTTPPDSSSGEAKNRPTHMHLRAFRATMSGMRDLYPCPCCGHLVFEEPPGSDDICMICFWEDDVMQLRWPQLAGVTNAVSLLEAQRNFARLGASEQRFAGDVRPPTATERLDEGWRPIQENDRFEEPEDSAPWPEDRTRLYYWRPTFWRARS